MVNNKLDMFVKRHDFEILKVNVDELKEFTPKLAKAFDVNVRIDKLQRELQDEINEKLNIKSF